MFAGLQVAVIAMASSAWEVRNAASLIFTALLIRMLGFRNLVKVNYTPPPHPPPQPPFSYPPTPSLPPHPSSFIAAIICKLSFASLGLDPQNCTEDPAALCWGLINQYAFSQWLCFCVLPVLWQVMAMMQAMLHIDRFVIDVLQREVVMAGTWCSKPPPPGVPRPLPPPRVLRPPLPVLSPPGCG